MPSALGDVILRALAKRPEARWQTAIDFGEGVRRAVGSEAHESVPIFDPSVRETWTRKGPQPIADAVAHVASAATTVEADAAVRELVAITCRWLAVIALAQLTDEASTAEIREKARAVVGRDNGAPWPWLARAIMDAGGDLVMRTSRGTLTIWERATGDNLVWNLEFLRGSFGAAFTADGRIETGGEKLGLIDIPRETRPVADILAGIECRVPLRVTGSRLDAAPTRCEHKPAR